MDGTSTADETAEASSRRMSNSMHRSFEHSDRSHQDIAHADDDDAGAFATERRDLPIEVKQHVRSSSNSSSSSRSSSARVDGISQHHDQAEAAAAAASSSTNVATDSEAAMLPARRASGGETSSHLDMAEKEVSASRRGPLVDSHYAASPSPQGSPATAAAAAETEKAAASSANPTATSQSWQAPSYWRTESDKLKRELAQSRNAWRSSPSIAATHAGPSTPTSSARPIKPLSNRRFAHDSASQPPPSAPAEPSSWCTTGKVTSPQRHGRSHPTRGQRVRWERVVIDPPPRSRRREYGDVLGDESRRRKLPGTSSLASRPAEGSDLPPVPKLKRRKVDAAHEQGQDGKEAGKPVVTSVEPLPGTPLGRPVAPSPPSVVVPTILNEAATSSQQPVADRPTNLFVMSDATLQYAEALVKTAYPSSSAPTPTHPPTHVRMAATALPVMRRAPRLKRALSLPNLRAVHVSDLSQTSTHRHILPPHLVQFISSLYNIVDDARRRSASSQRSAATITLPPLLPPITRSTLRELDMCEILKNPQLRHDLLFDANVQFRPNFDGERGKRKREACERYWFAIAREIEHSCTCTSFDSNNVMLPCQCKGKEKKSSSCPTAVAPRLPALLQELRAICLSILPPASAYTAAARETVFQATSLGSFTAARAELAHFHEMRTSLPAHHNMLSNALDPTLITQQREHGVLDAPALLQALASILASHCSPARRDLVDKMVATAGRGRIAEALRTCFEILELMKLDFANMQLRTTRAAIVENAHDFEQQWFRRSLEQGIIGLGRTTEWWHAASLASMKGATSATSVSQVFSHGFLDLVFGPPSSTLPAGTAAGALPSSASASTASSSWLNHTLAPAYPETFQFDAHRLWMLHNDVVDVVVVHMFLMLFGQLARQPTRGASAMSSDVRARINVLVQQQMGSVKSEVWALLNESSGSMTASGLSKWDKLRDPRWRQDEAKGILLHVASRAERLCEQAVRDVAGSGAAAPPATTAPPSTATMAMLESWLHKNMQLESPLMGLCVKRVRGVFAAVIASEGLPANAATTSVGSTTTQGGTSRRRRSGELSRGGDEEEEEDEGVHLERVRKAPRREEPAQLGVNAQIVVPDASASMPPSMPRPTSPSSWESQVEAAGLSAVSDEVCALLPRITQLTRLHLRTYLSLYEGLDRCALAV